MSKPPRKKHQATGIVGAPTKQQYNAEYYRLNRISELDRAKEYRIANPLKTRSASAAWHNKNKDKAAQLGAKFRSKNRDAIAARMKDWRTNNLPMIRRHAHRRRAALLNATPPWFGELDALVIAEAAEVCALREAATRIKWEIDHMIPLQAKTACGLHVGGNIQVIPAFANRGKRNRMRFTEPCEWIGAL